MELDTAVTLVKGLLANGINKIALDAMCDGTDWMVTIYQIEAELLGNIDNAWQLVMDLGLEPWTDFEEGVMIR